MNPYPYTGWTMFGRRYNYNPNPPPNAYNNPVYYDASAMNGMGHDPFEVVLIYRISTSNVSASSESYGLRETLQECPEFMEGLYC